MYSRMEFVKCAALCWRSRLLPGPPPQRQIRCVGANNVNTDGPYHLRALIINNSAHAMHAQRLFKASVAVFSVARFLMFWE